MGGLPISTPDLVSNIFSFDGFVFKGDKKRRKTVYSFPEISDLYKEYGKTFIDQMDQDQLRKKCKVFLRDEDGNDRYGWPLSRCISWETHLDSKKYVLSDGEWYQVDGKFYDDITSFFASYLVKDIHLPDANSNYGKESDYNYTACSSNEHFHLFDLGHSSSRHKKIKSAGNEICDIFDSEQKRFVHVKPGKASPQISHLLRQGTFSAQIMRTDDVERSNFHTYLEEDLTDLSFLDSFDPSQFTVSFALILGENQKRDIPFFSKVSFKDSATTIRSMGYKCEFGFISKLPELKTVELTELESA
ncbi:DUF6119 family protein [Pseudovibrio sp. Ad26]|uniref:DUF6119 family protein n=1 Tax=Pseudovibrio sp. Ad26 TaxID=989410 RepID=UPI0007AE6BAC|nr:DUF6119 family protein [Pseudovibrio sp. Ad26]KZL14399.1 hypothetical protein PsAD26_01310 [Pseudovibrio sp. Ad26]